MLSYKKPPLCHPSGSAHVVSFCTATHQSGWPWYRSGILSHRSRFRSVHCRWRTSCTYSSVSHRRGSRGADTRGGCTPAAANNPHSRNEDSRPLLVPLGTSGVLDSPGCVQVQCLLGSVCTIGIDLWCSYNTRSGCHWHRCRGCLVCHR